MEMLTNPTTSCFWPRFLYSEVLEALLSPKHTDRERTPDHYLIQEQPTLEIVSVGSATHATNNLKRSFSIVLIIFS